MTPQEFITVLQKILSDGIPSSDLFSLGEALATLKPNDWKSVASNIFVKDMKPIYHSSKNKLTSFKDLKNNIKIEGKSSIFKKIALIIIYNC